MKQFIKKILLINQIKILIGEKNYDKIKHFLRFYGLHFFGYEVSNNIYFGDKEADNYFLQKLKTSKLYLEYGCGSSTIVAKKFNVNFYSIEGDKNFYRYMKNIIKDTRLIYKSLGVVKYYSVPIENDFAPVNKISKKMKDLIHEYTSGIIKYFDEKKIYPDLILIDGRYRVLCALFLYNFLRNKNYEFNIIIDDYFDRPFYQVLDNYFEIIKVGRLGVATKIKYRESINEDINKYYLDCR